MELVREVFDDLSLVLYPASDAPWGRICDECHLITSAEVVGEVELSRDCAFGSSQELGYPFKVFSDLRGPEASSRCCPSPSSIRFRGRAPYVGQKGLPSVDYSRYVLRFADQRPRGLDADDVAREGFLDKEVKLADFLGSDLGNYCSDFKVHLGTDPREGTSSLSS